MEPFPHQIAGAEFLAARHTALLADAPRVGKTGSALLAARRRGFRSLDIITTASGRAVWRRAMADWWPDFDGDLSIRSWNQLTGKARSVSLAPGLVIADESHYAKNPTAQRTRAFYGAVDLRQHTVWCLSGTPMNTPNDLWPMLDALAPERLGAYDGLPDVRTYAAFMRRYCVTFSKHISRWKKIEVVKGGKNEDELRQRLDGFWMRRRQEDIGITKPIYDLLPIEISAAERAAVAAAVENGEDILDAAEAGLTNVLDMELAELRRLTGSVKAIGVARAVRDEMECGLDRVVLMCWHRDTMDLLASELSRLGVVRLDGSTSQKERTRAQQAFAAGEVRVFIGQMQAAGEAIDLSAAAELIFVESSWTPKDMGQAALRITNMAQQRQPRVRVAALEGSIDEALQNVVLRKMKTIRKVLE